MRPNVDGHTEERRGLKRLAGAVLGLIVVATGGAVTFAILDPGRTGEQGFWPSTGLIWEVPYAIIFVAFPVVGFLLARRRPDNAISWLILAVGAIFALDRLMWSYAPYAVHGGLGGRSVGTVVAAIDLTMWVPIVGIASTFVILLFPNGHLPSARWRWVAWAIGAVLGLAFLGTLLTPGPLSVTDEQLVALAERGSVVVDNPLGLEAAPALAQGASALSALLPIGMLLSWVALVRRYRRSSGIERLQIRVLMVAGGFVAVLFAIAIPLGLWVYGWDMTITPLWVQGLGALAIASFALIPISIGFAILKYRLYDIDLVINKTVVYGAMAGFITAVYVAIVVGIGRAIGSPRNLALSIAATALVAVAFQPVRERVQGLANRLVYGKRATPYEVLSEFSGGMSHTVATDELLPRMARIVAEGTGAARADVWLRLGQELVREASWPEPDNERREVVPVVEGLETTVGGADGAVPVRHQGELLGVIGVKKAPGEAVTPADEKLLEDLASQAGLVLRNVRLIEELRTSRQRLVSAQNEERRRLERDLHDGAQQRLVAIAVGLRMARRMVRPDSHPDLAPRLDQASGQLALALSELREFARGIHPAILTERGLVPALESLAERSTVPATVESSLDRRLPAPVAATAYFVVSEALANVGKHAKATAVTIGADARDDVLRVEVADDGVSGADITRGSGLRGLADRVAAVGGTLEIDSSPGRGTTLTCSIPLPGIGLVEQSSAIPNIAMQTGDVR